MMAMPNYIQCDSDDGDDDFSDGKDDYCDGDDVNYDDWNDCGNDLSGGDDGRSV